MHGDCELIEAVLRGEAEAADRFIARYSLFVYSLLQRDLGLTREKAEDLFQEVFLHLLDKDWRRLRNWSREGDFVSYLAPIIRNLVRDHWRSDRRRAGRLVEGMELEPIAAVRSLEPTPEELAEIEDQRAALVAALDRLEPNDRELYRLRFEGELSYRQISEAMGLSVANVGVRLNRMTHKLKRAVESATRSRLLPFPSSGESPARGGDPGEAVQRRRTRRRPSAARAQCRATI